MERRLAAIIAIDVVGYSLMMGKNEESTLASLHVCRKLIETLTTQHNGRTFGRAGDSVLAEFSSPVNAVRCAIKIQREMVNQNTETDGSDPMRLRIGINFGDAIVDQENLFGDGVNIAARLEALAQAGEIVISSQVYDFVKGKVSVDFIAMGKQKVKNITQPIDAYKIAAVTIPEQKTGINFGVFELDVARYELRESGQAVSIEPMVFDILVFLAQNSDRTVSREEIFAEIWKNRIVSDSALSSQIKAVRKAVGDSGQSQHTIRTIHGRGFRFVARIEETKKEPTKIPSQPVSSKTFVSATTKPSVAVLPFDNLAGTADENYLADGVTEDLITALSKNRWLNVVARNSVFGVRNSSDNLRVIGQKLEADYLVTGSLRKAGDRVRISVQVVEAETEFSIWVERFDRDIVDIFELQDEISETLTARIEAELGLNEQRKATSRPRKNPGSWELYQRAAAEFYKFSSENNRNCQELLKQVLEIDPQFASAYSRLAYSIILGMVYFDAPPDEVELDRALVAARRSIELDDQDANSHFTIGRVYLARCEYDLAINALEQAIALNPCLAQTYCGLGDSLAYEGRLDEAIEQFETAIRLSPHDPFRWAFYSYRSLAHLFRQEYQEAVDWARKSVEVPNAQYWARAHLVAALGHLGDPAKTEIALKNLLQVKPEFSLDFAREHLFYLKSQDQIDMYQSGLAKAGVR